MIGPHEGRELELMLAGKKRLAMFHDIAETETAEEIIPEKAFAEYVRSGQIIRIEETITSSKINKPIRFVFFAIPGEEWRAHTIIRINKEIYSNSRPNEELDDIIIGRLLDYTKQEVDTFISAI